MCTITVLILLSRQEFLLERSHINIQNPIYSNFIYLYVHDTKGNIETSATLSRCKKWRELRSILETKKRGQVDHTITEATHITRRRVLTKGDLEKNRKAKGHIAE